jgi:hypothetical protein
MGRILVKEGRFPEAISYFRRAIYGHWNEDAAGNRLRVRFELIDLLAQRNSKEELLAELLPGSGSGSSRFEDTDTAGPAVPAGGVSCPGGGCFSRDPA